MKKHRIIDNDDEKQLIENGQYDDNIKILNKKR